MNRSLPILALAAAFLAPVAAAGTIDAPELADATGDCAFAPGNEYLDVVSAWISDETATDFQVNLAIAKWTDVLGHAAGLTVQFTHQGTQWGVVYYYDAALGGWMYWTGLVTEDEVTGFNETSGSFTPGEPAVLTATFPKNLFPHNDPSDNLLQEFTAVSLDLKPAWPTFFSPTALPVFPPALLCDEAEGSATYAFGSGTHSARGTPAPEGNATAPTPEDATPTPASATPAPDAEAGKDTPAAGALAALAVAAGVALARRRR